MNIPLYKPYIGSKEKEAISRVLKMRKLTRGTEVEDFEREFAAYVGAKYAIAVNSGTSGLHILVRTMGWGKGDEIITTPFSYIASSNALLYEGVTPVFVDIDSHTLNIDPDKIEEKITSKTKGILLVHVLGLPANYRKILMLKKKYGLQIIEDACESLGKPSKDFTVTKLGEATVYSFHENKPLTTAGEGGMIVTNNLSIVQACWAMRDQGRSLKKNWIDNVTLGFNFRMTELQAAFGREQLTILDKMLAKREKIAGKYSFLLRDVKELITPDTMIPAKRSWFTYFVLFKTPKDRLNVYNALCRAGVISSTNYFPPIYKFPMYRDSNHKKCKNTEEVSERLLALPMFYEMKDEEIEYVAKIIKQSLKQ